ncbi:MAG: DUF1801 domain-containing protein [Patescibacteria group bacterium]
MTTVDAYIADAPPDRQESLQKLRTLLRDTLIPLGYEECISYGMIGYVVPFSLYPDGYHCDDHLPLPFINLAARKSGISLYHMGVAADRVLLKWWQDEYAKQNIGKLDMGVGCIRFKKLENIPYTLIQELAEKISAQEWIQIYTKSVKNRKR